MGRLLRKGVFFTLLFACVAPPASADPILMFLIGMGRQLIENRVDHPPRPTPEPLPDLSLVYPGTTVEPEHLRRLIDDSFVYLSESQRREIFDSLHAALIDPKNAPVSGSMIEYFATRALAVREAQQRLARLTAREKEQIAGEFRKEIAGITAEEAAQLADVLRQGLLPVPGDLNQMLLAALEER